MSKKITVIILTVVMMFSVMGATTAMAEAAATPFMTVNWEGPIKEKVGNYFIWVKKYENKNGDITKQELRTSKKSNVKGNLIKTITGYDILTSVISNGQTIYYGVLRGNKDQMVIYKTSITGKNTKKFRTINNVQSLCGPVAVYNNRLYYDRDLADERGYITWNIYSVDMNNKNCRLEKKGYEGQSSYGRYITCDNEFKDIKTQLYNVKTRKSTTLIKSWQSRVYNGNIYYAMDSDKGSYVKRTDLKGKNLTNLGAVTKSGWSVCYLGKSTAYFDHWETGEMKKLTYATKKIVDVK